MDKGLLRDFAIYSREKLIQDIKNQALNVGVSEKGIEEPLTESKSDMLLFDVKMPEPFKLLNRDIERYNNLISELRRREKVDGYEIAYESLIEEVAYTWFNRLIAIRFMEVNNYLPDKIRILSSGREGVNEPELVKNYRESSIEFSENELSLFREYEIGNKASEIEEMYKLLFIKQCNDLNKYLPNLFEKTNDYSELLLTISYNDNNGVLYKLVNEIPEEYFDVNSEDGNGQVEIIGWLYQYYNTVKKDEVFSKTGTSKISKEEIPAATQLFTPQWIVKYMVENSLGRLWIEKLIANGDSRSEKSIANEFGWKYYIPEANQNKAVQEKLIEVRADRKNLKIEEIKFIDPAMGSFHIGIYAFDVFLQLYESEGYSRREASKFIIEKNLYGIDIDKRAYQLSYFSIMMKGRKYNRLIFNEDIHCKLYYILESNSIEENHIEEIRKKFGNKNESEKIKSELCEIVDNFKDAREYGSIIKINKKYDYDKLRKFVYSYTIKESQVHIDSLKMPEILNELINILNVSEVLSMKYEIVITNPPYMGSRGMNSKLSKYVKDFYPDSKLDMFAVFIEKCKDLTSKNYFYAMITQNSWMFLSSFEQLRKEIQNNMVINMLHLGARAFEEIAGEVVQTTTFVNQNTNTDKYIGCYLRLIDFGNAEEKRLKTLEAIENSNCGYYYETDQSNFEKIPGSPIAYWASENVIKVYENNERIVDFNKPSTGMTTGDNNRFLRRWYEINFEKAYIKTVDRENALNSKKKWFPYIKGGGFKRWYGYNEYFINWQNNGYEIKNNINDSGRKVASVRNENLYFRNLISWSSVTSYKFSSRLININALFDSGGSSIYVKDDIEYILALLNSHISQYYLNLTNSTLNYQPGDIGNIPTIINSSHYDYTANLTKCNINISKFDWDTFETSWDFKVNPLADFKGYMDNYYDSLLDLGIIVDKAPIYVPNMQTAYENYKEFTNSQFEKLKSNEEELNRIFIEIYGLEDELSPEVSDRDITIAKIFDSREVINDEIKGNKYVLTREDVVKQFISYSVGCMFGRYSLDREGLVYAGGEWNEGEYIRYTPSKDNILLISENEYFSDDIVSEFISFVKTVYGENTLEENLDFIARALNGKGTSREAIRNYFVKDFFKDHLKIYQKRPIYWEYNSGKQNGFKALVYMHRYDSDTTGKVRIDYLHSVQRAYESYRDSLKEDVGDNYAKNTVEENNSDETEHKKSEIKVIKMDAREIAKARKVIEKLEKQIKECKDYDELISHLALSRIDIDLDDGVKVNYEKVQTDSNGKMLRILSKI